MATLFEKVISLRSKRRRVGRKRQYSVLDVFLFEIAVWLYGDIISAEDNLRDPKNWERLSRALEAAHPERSEWRLSPTPINRHKHYRFRKKYLSGRILRVLRKIVRDAAVRAAKDIGMLDPEGRNSVTRPKLLMVADATFLPALFKTPHWAAHDGDNDKRSDPDAITYRRNDRETAGSAGYMPVFLSARLPYGNERIIFDIGFADSLHSETDPDPDFNPNNDASVATKMFLDLTGHYRQKLANFHGLAYDMALRSIDADRLLDTGKLPITKIPYTAEGRPAEKNLGTHNFRAPGGNKAKFKVVAINGTPGIVHPDGNGELWFFPLKRVQNKKVRRNKKDKFAIQGTWAINDYNQLIKDKAKADKAKADKAKADKAKADKAKADKAKSDKAETPTIPGNGRSSAVAPTLKNLKGATTTITHNSSTKERNTTPHTRRTLAPPAHPQSPTHGSQRSTGCAKTQSPSSAASKPTSATGAAEPKENTASHLSLLAYQLKTIITALVAHQKRTEADLSKWFGKHQNPGDP